MKRIIKGRMYNTETATLLASSWNGLSCRDFGYCDESLYQKRTKEFFLCGEGGPYSKYSQPWGNSGRQSGEGIIPLTLQEAKDWVEENCSAEKFIEIFGTPEE